jgi:hypothetical protein
MKTTMNLDDDLFAAVRSHAAERRTTIRSVVEEALRRLLTDSGAPAFDLELPITRGERPPTVDVDSNAALDEYLDRAARDPAGE